MAALFDTEQWSVFCVGHERKRKTMWTSARKELREFLWLASMVSGLSFLGVTLAVALALALIRVA